MLENVEVFCHNSIKITGSKTIYIDPFKIDKKSNDARYIFITHSHYDHFSPCDIDKVMNEKTVFVCTGDVKEEIEKIYSNKIVVVEKNNKYNLGDISFTTFAAYNINKKFHPFSNGWVGYTINVNDVKYSILGDTDLTDVVKNIKCDVLFVPIGGTYTMNAKEASELVNFIHPSLVIPVHYNDIVGNKEDESEFLNNLNDIRYEIYL